MGQLKQDILLFLCCYAIGGNPWGFDQRVSVSYPVVQVDSKSACFCVLIFSGVGSPTLGNISRGAVLRPGRRSRPKAPSAFSKGPQKVAQKYRASVESQIHIFELCSSAHAAIET